MTHSPGRRDEPARSACRCRLRGSSRWGFTLLEIIVASVLVAVLMAAVWNILGVYGDLFERGQSRTEQVQLIRTLSQQLSNDLRGAIQDPVFVDTASTSPTGARRFGLYGTSNELRIDVLQIPAFDMAPTPTAGEMEDTTRPRKLQAPELRTVYYTFRDSAGGDPTDLAVGPGLTRRELDFETPDPAAEGVAAADGLPAVLEAPDLGELTATAGPDEAPPQASSTSTFQQLLREGMDNAVMWAPEVVALQFRYFDGTAWRSSWDSLARKGLPVAVEMTLAVSSLEGVEKIRNAAMNVARNSELQGELEGGIDLAAQDRIPQPRVHQVVVNVPNSPHYKSPQDIRRQAAPALRSPAPLPKVILTQPRARQRSERAAPDQWIRNE